MICMMMLGFYPFLYYCTIQYSHLLLSISLMDAVVFIYDLFFQKKVLDSKKVRNEYSCIEQQILHVGKCV